MDWNFNISPKKIEALKKKILELEIDISLIEEQFIHGSGKGGQKLNKTANCVRMTYPPLDIQVLCQKTRQRNQNRFLALRLIAEEAEILLKPEQSKRLRALNKKKKQKDRRRRRHQDPKPGAPETLDSEYP